MLLGHPFIIHAPTHVMIYRGKERTLDETFRKLGTAVYYVKKERNEKRTQLSLCASVRSISANYNK